jgi:hypothetical protein
MTTVVEKHSFILDNLVEDVKIVFSDSSGPEYPHQRERETQPLGLPHLPNRRCGRTVDDCPFGVYVVDKREPGADTAALGLGFRV